MSIMGLFGIVLLVGAGIACPYFFRIADGKNGGSHTRISKEAYGWGCFLTGCMTLVMLVGTLFSFHDHAHNIAMVRDGYLRVEVQEKRIEALQEHVSFITSNEYDTSLMNGDSPISSLMASLADAEAGLANVRMEIAEAKIHITHRRLGLFGFVPAVFPNE